ncbi:hypothetical protein ACFV9C_17100 [Kribbella sp. NPDC059898]|uniref:hypothetical protein n=1 Tax=Kribbella sp. NPDC059898 TaxID=3346995 RepID=UPI0036465DFB
MRQLLAVAGVVSAVFVAGCGADEGPATTAPSPAMASSAPTTRPPDEARYQPPTPAPVVRTAPTAPTLAAAGAKYLQITRPYNVALESFEKAANENMSVTTLQNRAKAVAAASLAESSALLKVTWPTSVSKQIRLLANADAAARPHWLKVAAAGTKSEMAAHLKEATAAGNKAPSAQIRQLLHLPKYNEKDYS